MRTDWLGNIGIQLILEDPFWGWLYRQLPRKLDEKVEEVSLVAEEQDGLTIAFHPSLEKKSLDPFFLTQVKHELLHFLLAHPLQRQQAAQKRYFDLAADLCVDQFLAAYPGSLQDSGLFWFCPGASSFGSDVLSAVFKHYGGGPYSSNSFFRRMLVKTAKASSKA
jgi:hypothetical protein